jgi:hypothetical protein
VDEIQRITYPKKKLFTVTLSPNAGTDRYPADDVNLSIPLSGFYVDNRSDYTIWVNWDDDAGTSGSIPIDSGDAPFDIGEVVNLFVSVYCASDATDDVIVHGYYEEFDKEQVKQIFTPTPVAPVIPGVSPVVEVEVSPHIVPLFPTVIKDKNIFKMWYYCYTKEGWKLFYSTSEDGIKWKKHGMASEVE